MLRLEGLQYLIGHSAYLRSVFGQRDLFFVWGVIRDLLLWFGTTPDDIDITCAWNPEDIFKELKKDAYHLFRTEKFGTMTVIPKQVELEGYNKDAKIHYELTPLRTEWWYADFRHPEEITRSDSIIADSKRRDFTINSIYAYVCATPCSKMFPQTQELQSAVFVLTAHEDIHTCFPDGQFSEDAFLQIVAESQKLSSETDPAVEKNASLMQFTASSADYADKIIILIDPHQWFQDLMSKTLRTVGEAHHRFGEDALRVMRGVRFVNILNHKLFHGPYAHYSPEASQQDKDTTFDFANDTWDAMKKNYYLVSHVAKERIKDEITKVFRNGNPFGYIALLEELNLLKFIFPALDATRGVIQPLRYHAFDVYAHTLLVVNALCPQNSDYLVRLAALYHDVGKTDQYYYFSQHISKEEKKLPVTHQMYHAQSLGPTLAQRDFKALGFSTKEIETICRYIAYHHRPGELLETTPENRTKKLRQLMSDVWPEMLLNLMDIAVADRRGQFNPIQPPATAQLFAMKDEITHLYEEEGRFTMKDLAIDGHTVMQELSLEPWPHIGSVLEKVFQRTLSDPKERNITSVLITYLKSLPKSENA